MLTKQQLQQKYLGKVTGPGFEMETFGTFRDQHKDLEYVESARKVSQQAWADTHGAIQKISLNYSIDPGARIKMIADIGKKRMDEALVLADVTRERLEKKREHVAIQARAATTPASPIGLAQAQELRSLLRSMPEAKRYQLLATARGDDQIAVWEAIASAPAVLSGVDDNNRAKCRDYLLGLRNPELLTLEGGVTKGLAVIEQASRRLQELMNDHIDFDSAAELRTLDL